MDGWKLWHLYSSLLIPTGFRIKCEFTYLTQESSVNPWLLSALPNHVWHHVYKKLSHKQLCAAVFSLPNFYYLFLCLISSLSQRPTKANERTIASFPVSFYNKTPMTEYKGNIFYFPKSSGVRFPSFVPSLLRHRGENIPLSIFSVLSIHLFLSETWALI